MRPVKVWNLMISKHFVPTEFLRFRTTSDNIGFLRSGDLLTWLHCLIKWVHLIPDYVIYIAT